MQRLAPEVLFEDNHLLIVNKPAGMPVQGDATGDLCLVDWGKAYIKDKYNKPGAVFCGLVHRLDRPTSGVVVLARTSKALERLTKAFRERKTAKTYWAVVGKTPANNYATLTHHLIKDTTKNKSKAFDTPQTNTKEASLTYSTLKSTKSGTLLEIKLHTGRHHQIRCQLAKIGHPIKGDLKYGYPAANSDGNISLLARSLTFEHPTKKEPITITASAPKNFH